MQQKNYGTDQNGDPSILFFDKKPQFEEESLNEVCGTIGEFQITPLVVGQRVLAVHPKTKELRTAQLLTSDIQQFHA